MKKILTNSDDISFQNKYKFNDLLLKSKALVKSTIKNGKKTLVLLSTVGCLVVSSFSLCKNIKSVFISADYIGKVLKSDKEITTNNDNILNEIGDDIIFVGNIPISIDLKYSIENDYLIEKNGNQVDLTNKDDILCISNYNITNDFFNNVNLPNSNIKMIFFLSTSIENDFINYLPNTLEFLSINKSNFITSLDSLPDKCPDIKFLDLDSLPLLKDLSFIYNMPNLKEVNISDSAYLTKDLLNYLKDNNIKTNITEEDLMYSQMTNNIINDIINENMSDEEKIKTVCLYVMNNLTYNISTLSESNLEPLKCALKNKNGVCASYAYLTTVLLNKANITSFEIINDKHAWNIVKLDEKYYYIDSTNMDGNVFYNFLLEKMGMTKYYMIDTDSTMFSSMTKPSDEVTIIPLSLINDIANSKDKNDIYRKYGNSIGNAAVTVADILYSFSCILFWSSLTKTITISSKLRKNIKNDYNKEYRRSLRKSNKKK